MKVNKLIKLGASDTCLTGCNLRIRNLKAKCINELDGRDKLGILKRKKVVEIER